MMPQSFDSDIVAVRLRLMRDLLEELRSIPPVDAGRLQAEPVTRAAVERFVQSIVDLAIDVNAHIAATELDQAPSTGRSSFELAARAGALDEELAERLGRAVGLRNILIHRYADIDVGIVAGSVDDILEGFGAYVKQVATFATAHEADRDP